MSRTTARSIVVFLAVLCCQVNARADGMLDPSFGNGGIVVRPSYIAGPGDTTDRFPYWPVRLPRGGDGCPCRDGRCR